MKKTLAILAGLAAFGVANAQVLDFEDLNNNGTGGFTLFGSSFDSGGYHFESIIMGTSDALASWTPDLPTFYTGSVSPFLNYNTDQIRMTKNGGGTFGVKSIMLADVYRNGGVPSTVTFVGTHSDSSTTTVTATLVNSENLETHMLNLNDLVKLEWDSGSIEWTQFDNVELVPEPATMIALGLGVAALARRRRK